MPPSIAGHPGLDQLCLGHQRIADALDFPEKSVPVGYGVDDGFGEIHPESAARYVDIQTQRRRKIPYQKASEILRRRIDPRQIGHILSIPRSPYVHRTVGVGCPYRRIVRYKKDRPGGTIGSPADVQTEVVSVPPAPPVVVTAGIQGGGARRPGTVRTGESVDIDKTVQDSDGSVVGEIEFPGKYIHVFSGDIAAGHKILWGGVVIGFSNGCGTRDHGAVCQDSARSGGNRIGRYDSEGIRCRAYRAVEDSFANCIKSKIPIGIIGVDGIECVFIGGTNIGTMNCKI